MDDGIAAIVLIVTVFFISLFFFVYFFESLIVVFLIISMVLIPLLVYTCLFVIITRWDKHKRMKEWDFLDKMEKIRKNES